METNPPAEVSSIDAVETYFNVNLPNDYKQFLHFTNGIEGATEENYLVIWSADDVIQLNEAYHVKEFVQNILIIGSNGADEAFAFDTNNMSIVNLPFIGMGGIPAKKLAETFEDFLMLRLK